MSTKRDILLLGIGYENDHFHGFIARVYAASARSAGDENKKLRDWGEEELPPLPLPQPQLSFNSSPLDTPLPSFFALAARAGNIKISFARNYQATEITYSPTFKSLPNNLISHDRVIFFPLKCPTYCRLPPLGNQVCNAQNVSSLRR